MWNISLEKKYMIRQNEGDAHAYHFLNEYNKRVESGKELPFMVDALNCAKGCLYGTGTELSKADDEDILFEIHKLRNNMGNRKPDKKSPWNTALSFEQRLKFFNEQFKHLRLEDFLCTYNTNCALNLPEPSAAELSKVFNDMGKISDAQRTINCSSCGYDTCKDMAKAIILGVNTPANCVHYLKDTLAKDKENLEVISEEIKEWRKKYKDVINSPYTSESFGGYAYTKSGGVSVSGSAGVVTWQSVFKSRLNEWRKL